MNLTSSFENLRTKISHSNIHMFHIHYCPLRVLSDYFTQITHWVLKPTTYFRILKSAFNSGICPTSWSYSRMPRSERTRLMQNWNPIVFMPAYINAINYMYSIELSDVLQNMQLLFKKHHVVQHAALSPKQSEICFANILLPREWRHIRRSVLKISRIVHIMALSELKPLINLTFPQRTFLKRLEI